MLQEKGQTVKMAIFNSGYNGRKSQKRKS